MQTLPDRIDVVIVGAGIAGTYVAWKLRQAEVPFMVLEATDHVGGRIKSRPERNSTLGLMLDEGANLINSTDTLAIKLLDRFNIAYVRRLTPGAESMHYLWQGTRYDQAGFDALLFKDSPQALAAVMELQEVWRSDATRDVNPTFIDESISHYLSRIAAGPVLTGMLESFFWSEYGHALKDLNLHVLFDYLDLQKVTPAFRLIPNVDEAFTVPDGTEQIIDSMLADIYDSVHVKRPVSRISDDGAALRVVTGDQTILADHVFFAAPLHALRHIELYVAGVTFEEVAQAQAATYARGCKLHLKFKAGFSDIYDEPGILLTDTGEQIWPSSTGQGDVGLLTVLTGPLLEGSEGSQALRVLQALENIAPGLSALYVGVERSDAPMSYSGSLRPGERPHLSIHDGGPRLTLVGEASSRELQGYLEGALRSADAGVTRYLVRRQGPPSPFGHLPQQVGYPIHTILAAIFAPYLTA
jgi:monoamine oxidase